MSKTRRDRVNFYSKSLSWGSDPVFSETTNAHRQEVQSQNGTKIFSEENLPLDVKSKMLPDRYAWKQVMNRSSQNQRKQIATLKKRRSRIERSRNNRIIDKEMKIFVKETIEEVKELNDYFKDIGL